MFSTPIRANRAGELHSSCVDVTGISDSGKQREQDPGHSRSQLFDQTNNSLTGNPFSAGGFAIDDSLSEEDSDVSVEPIFNDHPFPDLEQTYVNRGDINVHKDILSVFSSRKNNMTSTVSRIFKNNWMRWSKILFFVSGEQSSYFLKPKAGSSDRAE